MKKHLSLLLLAGLLAAAPGTLRARVDDQLDNIAVGTVYNLFHEEFETDQAFFDQVDKDIPAMAAAGITHLLVFPMNQWDPETKTRLWVRTDYLVRKLEKCGVKFVPLMLKEEQCSHYFPIWKYTEHPEILKAHLRNDGGRNNRENVDFADPAVYPAVEDNFKAVVARYDSSPALAFYNIWNEPHYSSTAPHVVARFKAWLQKRYGSLAALRRAWGEDYSSWDEVTPFLNDDWNSSLPGIDWRLFRGELNGQLLGQLGDSLRKAGATKPINANPVGAPWGSGGDPGGYNTDNWAFTPYNDFNGASYYPDAWELSRGGEAHPHWLHNLNFNIFRCAAGEKGYLLTEMYTNAKNGLTLGGYLDAATMNRLSWTALANDAKGILYWKWEPFLRGRQSLGRGLTRLDGQLAPRGEAVRDLASVVQRHGKLLLQARPEPAQIAILINQAGLLKTLDQPNDSRTRGFMYESQAGLFRALDEANLPVDQVRTDLGLSPAQLRKYRMVFLPFQIMVGRDLAKLLKDYVNEGGILVADARTATIDDLDIAYRKSPGAGLDEVFGAERLDWVASPGTYKVETCSPLSAFSFGGRFFREQLRVSDKAEVLAVFPDTKEPALIMNRFGKGHAYLAAVPLGASYHEKPENQANRLILSLCEREIVQAPVSYRAESGTTPSLRLHHAGSTKVLYVINPSTAPLSGAVGLSLPAAQRPALLSLTDDKPVQASQDASRLSIPVSLGPKGVQVIRIQ